MPQRTPILHQQRSNEHFFLVLRRRREPPEACLGGCPPRRRFGRLCALWCLNCLCLEAARWGNRPRVAQKAEIALRLRLIMRPCWPPYGWSVAFVLDQSPEVPEDVLLVDPCQTRLELIEVTCEGMLGDGLGERSAVQ